MAWFWPFGKKKEEDDLAAFEKELGLPNDRLGLGTDKTQEDVTSYDNLANPPGAESTERKNLYESQQSVQRQQAPLPVQSTDMQVISAKLDTIKAMLDLINQRLNSLEQNAEETKQTKKIW